MFNKKKILILKNDRVGDLFHSLESIKSIRKNYINDDISIILSEFNIGFSSFLSELNIKLYKYKYRLSIKEKLSILKLITFNNYTHIIILSPKSFYFYLPFLFNKIIFSSLVVNNKRLRPSNYFRKKLNFLTTNDRLSKKRKDNIRALYNNVAENIITNKFNPVKKIFIKNDFKKISKTGYILIHSKSFFLHNNRLQPNFITKLALLINKTTNLKVMLTGDLGENSYNDFYKSFNHNCITYMHNLKNDDLCELIKDACVVITPHGTISCIAAHYCNPIIDIFESTLSKSSFSEFRPINNNHYKFLIVNKHKFNLNKKIIGYLGSILN